MANIIRSKSKSAKKKALPKSKFEFVGRGWKNISKQSGEPYVRLQLDSDIKELKIVNDESVRILLFKNNKRDGKRDADYRLVLAMPDENNKEENNESEIDF